MSRIMLILLTLTPVHGVIAGDRAREFVNTIGMKLTLVPSGDFTMGTGSDEDVLGDEHPQHKVLITKPFYLSVTEVTQQQYRKVMNSNPSAFKGDTHPVERVSWNDAVKFCKKLSAREGRTYRLPTEAEWEYACRAGSRTRYCCGDDSTLLQQYGWFMESSGKTTHPVGKNKPNAWGLCDMHGNVMEWCSDYYESDYYMSSPTNDPKGAADISNRVCRGGDYQSPATNCRSAARYQFPPSFHTYTLGILGFRVATSVDHEQIKEVNHPLPQKDCGERR